MARFAYKKQTPCNSPALPWQNFGQSPAHFHGYPSPSPRDAGAVVLNLNGLLVIRQIDNTSPGGAPGGKLVPGSHKRCELGHTVIRHPSRGDHDSLWKETTFARFFASRRHPKSQSVLISTTPTPRDKAICGYSGFIPRPLYSNISLQSFLLFLRDSRFS